MEIKSYEVEEKELRNNIKKLPYGDKILEIFDELAKGKIINFKPYISPFDAPEKGYLETESYYLKLHLREPENIAHMSICRDGIISIDSNGTARVGCYEITHNIDINRFEEFLADMNKAFEIYKKVFGKE